MSEFKVEEVESVPPPPRARVDVPAPSFQRKVDYLDGFLNAKPEPVETDDESLRDAIVEALKEIYDPEIPVNIYELGLIYDVVVEEGHVTVNMTLTTPHCPVAESMPAEVEIRVGAVPGVGVVDVNLVWDPPWDPSKMSDEARLELGML